MSWFGGNWRLALPVLLAAAVAGGVFGVKRFITVQETAKVAIALTGGNPDNAAVLSARYGCGGCHTIPGVAGAHGQVGPMLASIEKRVFIGGMLLNTTDNLTGWIVDPRKYSPHSAMPATGITADEARDMAAYLYSH